jgi:hypothetical protein
MKQEFKIDEKIVVVVCVTIIAGVAMYVIPQESKEIAIGAVSGLVGYLGGKK